MRPSHAAVNQKENIRTKSGISQVNQSAAVIPHEGYAIPGAISSTITGPATAKTMDPSNASPRDGRNPRDRTIAYTARRRSPEVIASTPAFAVNGPPTGEK